MIPTEDQERALERITSWFHNEDSKTFRLGGLAGTGKSSMIIWIHERLGITPREIQYVAPTNKASLVVQRRLEEADINANARTLHKAYYRKMERHCDDCPMTESTRNICHGVSGQNRCGCLLDFHASISSNNTIKLVVCDESSMVNREVFDDLMDLCGNTIKVLFVGDHGQLEAVDENPSLTRELGKFNLMHKPDFVLEQIQRQAKGSPILSLAYDARHGKYIDYGNYGLNVSKVKLNDELDFDCKDPNLIGITYFSNVDKSNAYHNGRISVDDLNRIWRSNLGMIDPRPVAGDRVVCRDYIRSASITKGTLGTITRISYPDNKSYLATIVLQDGREYEGLISAEQFFNNKVIWGRNHLDKWDFGYALTCHTAQGSEFDSVVVFEPPMGFIKWLGSESYSRWLYTAITRAKHNLLLVGS